LIPQAVENSKKDHIESKSLLNFIFFNYANLKFYSAQVRWTPKILQDDFNDLDIKDLHSIGGIEELTILGTVDGFLHGVDRSTNRLLWSTSSGKAMLGTTIAKKIQQSPSNDAQRIDNNNESAENSNNNSEMNRKSLIMDTIIPTIDGNVLIHSDLLNSKAKTTESFVDDDVFVPSNTMRKTSVTARVLVENTPFISQEGVLFTGQKTSSLVGLDVDLHTGELVSAINSNIHVSVGTSDHNPRSELNAVQQTSSNIHSNRGKHSVIVYFCKNIPNIYLIDAIIDVRRLRAPL
jgi:hypothetical protein